MSSEEILRQVEENLVQAAGFPREAVLRDYAYADYLGPRQEVRQVALAAFAETPPSYRSACVAVAALEEDEVASERLSSLRALGAPRVITLGPSRASIWKLRGKGRPEHLEDRPSNEVANVIRTSAADWSPQAILRARGVEDPGAYQLDFGDLGLVPLIEQQVNEKLDRLIHQVIADCIDRDSSLQSRRGFPRLVRAVFWLLTAKVLADRKHPSVRESLDSVDQAFELAWRHYGGAERARDRRELIQRDGLEPRIAENAWQQIRAGFHFQNLSVDALAFVYENTLVSPEIRQRLGVHGTPRAVAELVVSLLPLEDLPQGGDVILEPCAGFGPFLLAALRRLRSGSLVGLDPHLRHRHLVRRLRGIELDPFATEVGRLCLTLADYPNADGWQLIHDDVFAPGVLEDASQGVGTVLANPPFEAFDPQQASRYEAVRSEPPAELLRRVLEDTRPAQLGFVLPRRVLDSPRSGYRELRNAIRCDFREVDTVELPDKVFEYSDAETVLLIARNRQKGARSALRTARVTPGEVGAVLGGRWQPRWQRAMIGADEDGPVPLRIDELAEIWARLANLPTLSDVTEIHRGVEYKRSLKAAEAELISDVPKTNMAPGVRSGRDLAPYRLLHTVYLSLDPDEIRRAGDHPWHLPKVIINAARRSRGGWRLTAAPDATGKWLYQNLTGVWPTAIEEWPIEAIAAVLNGPLANAFSIRREGRHIHRGSLAAIPLPDRSHLDLSRIIDLVHRAMVSPDLETVLQIDAEVLRGYDLPPRLERRLLLRFEGEARPGIPGFRGYYPADFDSALPLHRVLTDLEDRYRAKRLLHKVPVLHAPEVSEMFERLAAGADG